MSLLSTTAHQAHFSSFSRTLFTIAGFKPFLLSFVPSTQRSKQQDWSYTAFWYCSNCSSIDMGWECTDWKRRARLKFTFCSLCLLVCSGMFLIWKPLHWLLADMQINHEVLSLIFAQRNHLSRHQKNQNFARVGETVVRGTLWNLGVHYFKGSFCYSEYYREWICDEVMALVISALQPFVKCSKASSTSETVLLFFKQDNRTSPSIVTKALQTKTQMVVCAMRFLCFILPKT